jgi:hypothetical protein
MYCLTHLGSLSYMKSFPFTLFFGRVHLHVKCSNYRNCDNEWWIVIVILLEFIIHQFILAWLVNYQSFTNNCCNNFSQNFIENWIFLRKPLKPIFPLPSSSLRNNFKEKLFTQIKEKINGKILKYYFRKISWQIRQSSWQKKL